MQGTVRVRPKHVLSNEAMTWYGCLRWTLILSTLTRIGTNVLFISLHFLSNLRLTLSLSIQIPVITNIENSVQLITIRLCSGLKFISSLVVGLLLQLLFCLIHRVPHHGPLVVLKVMSDKGLCGVL